MHQLLTAKQADTYRPFQDLESKKLIYDLLQSPDKFALHNRRYSNSGTPFALNIDASDHVSGFRSTNHDGRRRR